jgi:hypothetical protein
MSTKPVYLNFDMGGAVVRQSTPFDVSLTMTSRSLYLRLKRKVSNNLPSQLPAPSHSSNLSDAYRVWDDECSLILTRN